MSLAMCRLGSWEGMSAAVDVLYKRLMQDQRTSTAMEQVPDQALRYALMELMALSMEGCFPPNEEECEEWEQHCQSIFQEETGSNALVDHRECYSAMVEHLEATLADLGVQPQGGAAASGSVADE